MTITGAAHIHSSFSYDAKLSVAEICAIAKRRGLSFVCMTEHSDELTPDAALAFVSACAAASDDTFVCIPGFEVNYGGTHVLMIGCRTFVSQHATAADIALWKSGAALAVHAHPHRDGYCADEALLSVLDGVEVWNAQYDGKYVPRNGARSMLGRLNKTHTLKAFCGWDFHRASHDGGPVLTVHVDRIDEASILAALTGGNYTLGSKKVLLGSDGALLRGNALMVSLQSAFFTAFIGFSKGITASLAFFGIRIPKPVAAFVRSRI